MDRLAALEQTPVPASWQAEDVHALLWFPEHMVDHHIWGPWIKQRGGLHAVYAYLRGLALSDQEQQLIVLYLEQPRATTETYSEALHISSATYFRRRARLLKTLATQLNEWRPAAPQQPTAESSKPPARNLPLAKTSFVGRAAAVAQLDELLRRPGIRLITLTGLPGVGKTRLALETARLVQERFRDGALFVPLGHLADPALVSGAICQALKLAPDGGGDQSIFERLAGELGPRELLLVMDNFEHLLEAAPLLGKLLDRCPQLRVLCTSRAPLQIYGEHDVPVLPLPLVNPDRLPERALLLANPALTLLRDRIHAVRGELQLTPQTAGLAALICARLDGLPLAIELAAAWTKVLSLPEICERLDQKLTLLKGGPRDAPSRHQTLRTAIEWSYRLLPAAAQELFSQLAIFQGGWTIESMAAVCGQALQHMPPAPPAAGAPAIYEQLIAQPTSALLEALRSLVENSLVQAQEQQDGTTRFSMLETLRDYALEQLSATTDAQATALHHAHYCLALAERAYAELRGPQQVRWIERLRQEQANLRAVLTWALQEQRAELAVRMGIALSRFWYCQNQLREGRDWLARLVPLGEQTVEHLRAELLYGAGMLASRQGDYQAAIELHEQCLHYRRAIDDKPAIVNTLVVLGYSYQYQGDDQRARAVLEEALALSRSHSTPVEISNVLGNLGTLAIFQDRADDAIALYEECLAVKRQLNDVRGIGIALNNLGKLYICLDRLEQAQHATDEGKTVFEQLGDSWGLAHARENHGLILLRQGMCLRARTLLQESLACYYEQNAKEELIWCLESLALVAVEEGNAAQACQLFGVAAVQRARQRSPLPALAQRLYAPYEARARAALAEQAAEEAWRQGERATLTEMVALALAERDGALAQPVAR